MTLISVSSVSASFLLIQSPGHSATGTISNRNIGENIYLFAWPGEGPERAQLVRAERIVAAAGGMVGTSMREYLF
jgi:hypothetical protein